MIHSIGARHGGGDATSCGIGTAGIGVSLVPQVSRRSAVSTVLDELDIDDAELAASQFLGLITGVEHSGVLLGIADAETELQRRKRIDTSVDAFMKLYGRN